MQNFRRDKKRIEETKKKRREKKYQKRLDKKQENPATGSPAPDHQPIPAIQPPPA